MNILIIRSGAIGDVLMTTPLLRGIRKKFPRAHISYLVGEWSKGVLEDNPHIDQILFFDDSIIFKKRLFKVLEMVKKIRKIRFDVCIILDKSYLWNLFALLCGIPERYGFSRNWEGFCNTKSVPFDGSKHELDYYLKIGKMFGVNVKNKKMELNLDCSFNKEFASLIIQENKLKREIIGIGAGGARNPGQDAPIKRWPRGRYINLIDRLSDKYDIILFGDAGDDEINKGIIRSVRKSKRRIINLTNLTIQQSTALIDRCKYFITHDSGLLHLAAITKTKTIAIFGPTSEKRFAPKNATVVRFNGLKCSPCYNAKGKFKRCDGNVCMSLLHEGEVLKQIK